MNLSNSISEFSDLVGPVRLPLEVDENRVLFFKLWYIKSREGDRWAVAVYGDLQTTEAVPLRIESACFFGHVFGSRQCDCGFQLKEALRHIADRGIGVVIYGIDQDARGNRISAHFRIYDYRQNKGLDTDEVFRRLNAPLDARSYKVVPIILKALGVSRIDLMSNNPKRIAFLREHGFDVIITPLEAPMDRFNMATLMLEKEDLGYYFTFRPHGDFLRKLQQEVGENINRRAGSIVRDNQIEVASWVSDDWNVAVNLTQGLAQGNPSEALVVYLSDLPRLDEIDRYARIGVGFIVVPFAQLPPVLVERAKLNGIVLQDWGRSNAYPYERPQWLPVSDDKSEVVYERANEQRRVPVKSDSEALRGSEVQSSFLFLPRRNAAKLIATQNLLGVLLVDTFDKSPVNMLRFRQFNPFNVWPEPCLSVPGREGERARSVESVWQGLKLIDSNTDIAQFLGTPTKRPDDDARRRDPNYRYKDSRFSYQNETIPLIEARFLIYAIVYLELLEAVVDTGSIDEIYAAGQQGNRVIFFDWDDNGDIANTRSSFAHSALLAAWFGGRLESFLFEPARRHLGTVRLNEFNAMVEPRLKRYTSLHQGAV